MEAFNQYYIIVLYNILKKVEAKSEINEVTESLAHVTNLVL